MFFIFYDGEGEGPSVRLCERRNAPTPCIRIEKVKVACAPSGGLMIKKEKTENLNLVKFLESLKLS